jgi:type I restriction-modification system DNA methylase subunit
MASKYDDLDATAELEQEIETDLTVALAPRGCIVVHHGTATQSAPAGRPDIEIQDPDNRRLILVEVTRRRGSAADGEFISITDHLDKAIRGRAIDGYTDFECLFVSPGTSARMATNIHDRYNRDHERQGLAGRIIAVDFAGLEMMLNKMATSAPSLYPAERLGTLFARWADARDDHRTRELIAEVLFPEERGLAAELASETRERDTRQEKQLRKGLETLENKLRERGITGNAANATLVYLTFIRLYEEKRQREAGLENRFTGDGFRKWTASLTAQVKNQYSGRLVEALLHEIAEDPDLKRAGLLRSSSGAKEPFHSKLDDALVYELVLPLFDKYDFFRSTLDVLGVVFETLARRGEKDTRVGQFFTPQAVVDFGAEIAGLRATDTVLDPAVGTARFLIAAMERMLPEAASVPLPRQEVETRIRQRQLLGVDIDDWVSRIAKMNMFIHGDGKSHMQDANGLVLADRHVFDHYPDGVQDRIDVVLTNPPLGDTSFRVALDTWARSAKTPPDDAERIKYLAQLGVVPLHDPSVGRVEKRRLRLRDRLDKASTRLAELKAQAPSTDRDRRLERAEAERTKLLEDLTLALAPPEGQPARRAGGEVRKGGALFLGAIANYLKPVRDANARIEWQGGVAVVVVDEAVLNTPEYSDVRAFIRDRYYVKAVVSLGKSAFQYLARTDAKTSVLFLIRKPQPAIRQVEPIFFAHAERVGYSATGNWIGNDLPAVLEAFRRSSAGITGAYRGHYLDRPAWEAVVRSLPGHGLTWHARLDTPVGGDRLDYFDARTRDIIDAFKAAGAKLVRLGELVEPRALVHPAPSRTGEYDFAVVERRGVVSAKGRQRVSYGPADLWVLAEGDLVVSGIDLVKGAAGVVGPDTDGLVMSKEMYAYAVRPGVDLSLEYLATLLRTEVARALIYGLVSGTSNRTRLRDASQLLELEIPAPPERSQQDEVVQPAVEARGTIRAATQTLQTAQEQIAATWPARAIIPDEAEDDASEQVDQDGAEAAAS